MKSREQFGRSQSRSSQFSRTKGERFHRQYASLNRPKKNVVIVDDDENMHLALHDMLYESPEFTFVGCYANTALALAEIPRIHPDVVLMDIRMPGINGIECTRRLRSLLPELKIIMLTGMQDVASINQSLQAGASDYLAKPVSAAQCLATLRFIVNKEHSAVQMPATAEQKPPSSGERAIVNMLTARETEVMDCLAIGLLYKEIADRLGISYSAVHKHQHRIFLKLHVSNRSEAIIRWRMRTADW